jgi:hypothetical protein
LQAIDKNCNFLNLSNMNSLLKNLGLIIFLCGVICLCVYYFGTPSNALLVSSLVLEFVGILTYIIINKRID